MANTILNGYKYLAPPLFGRPVSWWEQVTSWWNDNDICR